MEKKEKTSPIRGTNIFDPATLLGASPFASGLSALPFAHVSHLPTTFSMLGHPAFPVSSLFGHLGDGLTSPLGIPLSLATSLSPTSGKYGLFSSTSSPLSSSLTSPMFSTAKNMSSPSSSFAESTTTTTSSALSKLTSSRGRRRSPTTNSRGRGGHRGGRGGRGRRVSKQSAIPLSLVQSSSILSPSMLEKYSRQVNRNRESNGTSGLDSETYSDKSSISSLFDTSRGKSNTRNKKTSPSAKKNSVASSLSPPPETSLRTSSSDKKEADTYSHDKVHIDSLKKKLIADQIRQRVQNKLDMPRSNFSSRSGIGGRRRARGRPPKISEELELSPKELEEQTKIQERIKRELEKELKQQQVALKLMKKSQANTTESTNSPAPRGRRGRAKDLSYHQEPMNLGKLRSKSADSVKDQNQRKENHSPSKSSSREEEMSTPTTDSSKSQSMDTSSMDDTNDSGETSSESESEQYGSSQENTRDTDGSGKRKAEDDGKKPIKRRHVVLDDSKIKIPLDKGWKRQTNIHTYGRRGIVGEVWYFAPCGRKMKTIPDVMRYLERHPADGLGRDTFSFNTKVNVGEFYEARVGASDNGFVKLTDNEIQDRLSVTVSRRMKKIENQKKREKLKMQQILARQMIENKIKQKNEQQEMARKVAEIQFQKRIEQEQQKELLRRAKQMKMLEKRKQRDHIRLIREQERVQRDERIRIKREMRAQQILEKKRRKQEEARQRRYVAELKKTEERELKIQQANMIKEQIRLKQVSYEQERRRQHMLLLKALEQRKKQEDRERQREEKIAEKRLSRERKEEQRRVEFMLAQELKKPREDMELRDARPLPELPRIPSNLLDGEPFADCLMCLEFLHNFAKCLGFDASSLPTLKGLQDAVLSKTEEDGEEYISLVTHLLRYALDDPGVPNPKEAVTKLGQKIVDIEVTDAILSEVLRVFMVVRNGGETELSEYLRSSPIEACTVVQRAAILAFLCNELNCGKNIITEIENHLDHMGDIRRDKWVVEGKLRRLRRLRLKKFNRCIPKNIVENGGDGEDSMMTTTSKQTSDDEEEKDENSCNEDETFTEEENQDDDPTTPEECEKLVDKLQKQHAQYREKVFAESHHVRAIDLGQDRFKRRYWVLPHSGGVFVEGMESGDPEIITKVKNEKADVKGMKIEVLGEKEEKKGVTLLEEVEEKKGIDILDENQKKKSSDEITQKEEAEETNIKVESKEIGKSDENGIKRCGEEINTNQNVASEASEKIVKVESVKEDSDQVTNSEQINGNSEKHLKTDHASEKVVQDDHVWKERETPEKPLQDTDQEKPHSRTNSGNANAISSKSSSKHVELKIPKVNSSAIEAEKPLVSSANLFLQVPQSTKLSDFCSLSIDNAMNSEATEISSHPPHLSTSLTLPSTSDHMISLANQHTPLMSTSASGDASLPQPPPAHSTKHSSDQKSSFISIDSILEKKTSSSQNNHFLPSVLSIGVLASQHLKAVSDSYLLDNKPWFSILPRVPCDDMSLTRGQHSSLSSGMMLSPTFLSQLPFHPYPLQSPSFSSFQMGQLLSNGEDQKSVPSGDESFKKPEKPAFGLHSDAEMLLKSLQGEAKPIPEDLQKGWWRIDEKQKIQDVQKNLHPRGIREKNLQKTVQKFYEYTYASCTKAKKELICLESDESEEEEEEEEVTEEVTDKEDGKTEKEKTEEENEETTKTESEEDTQKGEKRDGTDKEEKSEEVKEKKKMKKEVKVPVIDCKAKVDEADRLVLEEIESLEDKVACASLQIKGWKLAPKTYSDESEVKIISRGEPKKTKDDMYPLEMAKERLLQLESNIERRYLKPPLSKVQRINLNNMSAASHNDSFEEDSEREFESLPIGLQTWRIAVATASSPAQLMLCIMQMNKSISWEKSIMKVLCQICRKDDNEAELLLCDGCDRGYHTYCFKPKLESVPDGDWYCYECVSKAAGESCCLVCGRRLGRMAECHACSRCVHIDCLDPPLPRVPRKWFCASCEDAKGNKGRRARKNSTANSTTTTPNSTTTSNSTTTTTTTTNSTANSTPSTPVPDLTPSGRKRRSDFGIPRKRKTSENQASESDSPKKKDNSEERQMSKAEEREKERASEKERIRVAEQSSDMRICRTILTEMMKHEDGWPFLQPVNCKHFPSYRKYIKTPMDFGTMKVKLRDHGYNKRSEFVSEGHLVFDNCKLFNEDDSEVGQCGHNMKKYFVKRWKEVVLESMENSD